MLSKMRNHFGCIGGEGVCEVYPFRCFITLRHLVDRERAATHQAPTTHPSTTPPSQQYNSSTAAVEQHVPTNP